MHDLGHGLGAIAFAAAALGWRTALLPVPDAALAALLGIDTQHGPEAEHPDALVVVHPDADPAAAWARTWRLDHTTVADLRALPKHGAPDALSRDHQSWPAIDAAIEAARSVGPPPPAFWARPPASTRPRLAATPAGDARALFHRRRSAVAMDGRTRCDLAVLGATLERVCDPESPPLQWLPWRSRVHLVLFV